MFKYLLPIVVALSLQAPAAADEEKDPFPLPSSIQKCYEQTETDSQVVDCTQLEADHWENQVNVTLRQAELKCHRLASLYDFDPNYGMNCRKNLHQGHQAWFNYRSAMLAAQCGDRDDSFMSYECAAMRSRLTKEYLDVIYAFYRLYQEEQGY